MVLNLGTPDSPEIPQVKSYLEQFLMDPYVIDIPRPLRWILIHGLILRTRPPKSSAAYKTIWTPEGSPLLVNTQKFASGLATRLESQFDMVLVGMRYGHPSIETALRKMASQGVQKVTVFSMYPQYAESSTRTGIEEVKRARELASTGSNPLEIEFIPPYFANAEFVEPYVSLVKKDIDAAKQSNVIEPYVLMSFHGLPQRHLSRLEIGCAKKCGRDLSCCEHLEAFNANCYRAQSFETARRMAKSLGLTAGSWGISFQSRLGPGWIQPFTDVVLQELPAQGKRDLVVVCPSFTSDCLETLEEIGIRGKETFMAAGGSSYRLVPCLNASPEWVSGAARLIEAHLPLLGRVTQSGL